MTQDEMIEMATEAGLAYNHDDYPEIWDTYMNVGREEIMAFAKLIAAKEREACAKMVEDYMKETAIMEARGCLASVAYDIRARGDQA
jgi:hypothetical protein